MTTENLNFTHNHIVEMYTKDIVVFNDLEAEKIAQAGFSGKQELVEWMRDELGYERWVELNVRWLKDKCLRSSIRSGSTISAFNCTKT